MARTVTFSIARKQCVTCDNSILVWFEVSAGDSPRDYMFADYKPQSVVAKFRTEIEAEAYVTAQDAHAL